MSEPTPAATTPQYTEYQLEMARAYGVQPSMVPPEEPGEPAPAPAQRRNGVVYHTPAQTLTPREIANDLAAKYGVDPKYWPVDQVQAAEQAAQEEAHDQVIEARLARLSELAKKYNMPVASIPRWMLEMEEPK